MIQLPDSEAPISLHRLAKKIRAASNMRFEWQWCRFPSPFAATQANAQWLLDWVIQDPSSHEFLRLSFDDMYDPEFKIEPLHAHSRVAAAEQEFENLMARAAAHRLGAYSRSFRESTKLERWRINRLFSKAGDYRAFQLEAGKESGCELCRNHTNHLFSSWFFDVAWDWCFILIWGEARLAWMACLTDTD